LHKKKDFATIIYVYFLKKTIIYVYKFFEMPITDAQP